MNLVNSEDSDLVLARPGIRAPVTIHILITVAVFWIVSIVLGLRERVQIIDMALFLFLGSYFASIWSLVNGILLSRKLLKTSILIVYLPTAALSIVLWAVTPINAGLLGVIYMIFAGMFVSRYAKDPLPSGYCQACGYNLEGNQSGICPECGTMCKVNQTTKPKAKSA